MRFHQDTIEAVKERVDIYEIVSEKVVLRKQGKDFVGLCPFHEEKTPSFSISPSKQMYYCFGCGKGGNAITFLKEINQQSFADVVLDLAQRYQVPVRALDPEKQQEFQRQLSVRDQLYEILAVATDFYQHALRQPQGKLALGYVRSERKLSEETLQAFKIGYAPGGWETLYGYLVEQRRYPVELVERTGLIAPRKKGVGYYDRLRDRLVIPICDASGRIIGFGGRSLGDEQPKYLNSPETELFDKGQTLFAIDKAKSAIAKEDKAIIVEGYFDAIALHAVGISNAVASLGTALSASQLRQLLRYTESKQIVLNFDADTAGIKAASRAISEVEMLAYRGEVQLRILNISEGKDADEFLRAADVSEYRQLVQTAPFWLDWQIDRTLSDRDLDRADDYNKVARELVKLLVKIEDLNTRTHYLDRCAEKLSRNDDRLKPLLVENLLARIKREGKTSDFLSEGRAIPPLPENSERNLLARAEADLLRIYLHCPAERDRISQSISDLEERDIYFSFSHHRFLWQQLVELCQKDGANSHNLISKLQDRLSEFPDRLQQISPLLHLDETSHQSLYRLDLIVRSALASIERVICQKRYRQYIQLWSKTDCRLEAERSRSYQEKLYAEKARMEELDRLRLVSFQDLVESPLTDDFL